MSDAIPILERNSSGNLIDNHSSLPSQSPPSPSLMERKVEDTNLRKLEELSKLEIKTKGSRRQLTSLESVSYVASNGSSSSKLASPQKGEAGR